MPFHGKKIVDWDMVDAWAVAAAITAMTHPYVLSLSAMYL